MSNKYVRETAAGKSVAAWVILNKKGKCVATIQAHYGNNRTLVNVFTDGEGLIHSASASGYGYDKFTAALSGAVIDGVKITDHCGEALKVPSCGYFSEKLANKRGYRAANYANFDVVTGKKVTAIYFEGEGYRYFKNAISSYDVKQNPDVFAEVPSERVISRPTSVYRVAGLDILPLMGYTVIQAI